MVSRNAVWVALAALVLGAGCNGVLSNDVGHLAPGDSGAGTSGVGGSTGGGGIGTLGQACDTQGKLACAGHAQKSQLICNGSKWQSNGVCSGSMNCASTGSDVGSCQQIAPECAGKNPGAAVCSSGNAFVCGPDLVTLVPSATCTNQACVAGACTGACSPGALQCKGAVPQRCDWQGTWQDGAACQHACTAGACTGVCAPGSTRCGAVGVETCSSNGAWSADVACSWPKPACIAGACVAPPSCSGSTANCGASASDSCCASPTVVGGTFYRSYDAVTYTDMTHPATVSTFRLDKYLITVGRFRKFIAAWDGGWRPLAGAGKHTYLNSGNGLAATGGGYESGWNIAWASGIATTQSGWDANLQGDNVAPTWTPNPGTTENFPIVDATWYELYAFCIWDGGFLPSEAEWNYAASGGSDQRVYPWSSPPSSTTIDCSYCTYHPGTSCVSTFANDVGSESPKGDGRWGQCDMAGEEWENVLDWYAPYASCNDCAALTPGTDRALRGGANYEDAPKVVTSIRNHLPPGKRSSSVGGRCARRP